MGGGDDRGTGTMPSTRPPQPAVRTQCDSQAHGLIYGDRSCVGLVGSLRAESFEQKSEVRCRFFSRCCGGDTGSIQAIPCSYVEKHKGKLHHIPVQVCTQRRVTFCKPRPPNLPPVETRGA
eukprot:1397522-Pleurochrysis_carterae.AAC.1